MDNYYISMKYEESLTIEEKKLKGIYYTPKIIVNYILEETLLKHNIIENPEPRILDLSCGCGNFLIESFDILYTLINNNIERIKEKFGDNYIKDISIHIIDKCIFGIDIDENAIEILKKTIQNKIKTIDNKKELLYIKKIKKALNKNIIYGDGLKYVNNKKFDYILGNPPYIGHKLVDKEYKKFILKEYKDVYRDKADLYFCFYKKALDLLRNRGMIGYITPRYFLESQSGSNLREYLFENSKIDKIIDLKEAYIFKRVGVSPVIMILKKVDNKGDFVKIYKNIDNKLSLKNKDNLKSILNEKSFEKISIKQYDLKDNWILINNEDLNFYNKIQKTCEYCLGDIVISFQGIITGCDKAFVLDKNDSRNKYIDKKLLKKWIKNKNISSYVIEEHDYKLIYSNDIINIEDYKYIEENCFLPYKLKLENRRECKKGMRKWYELQWGRDKNLFENIKIMYPYKSNCNKFAIDYEENFASADVYSFIIKEEFKNQFSYEYLIGLLNSKIYDRYFKLTAKNMGNKLYDYYPNKVMKIKIFKDDNYDEIESLSKKIIDNKITIKNYKKTCDLQDKEIAFNKEIYYLENESHFLENRISKLIIKSLNL